MKISMDKQYTYRNGEPARILCVDRPSEWPVVSMDQKGNVYYHNHEGRRHSGQSSVDLIEVQPFKVDEPVMVRDDGIDELDDDSWVKRHYAGQDQAGHFTYRKGRTSWTHFGYKEHWDQCRRPTPEELEQQA